MRDGTGGSQHDWGKASRLHLGEDPRAEVVSSATTAFGFMAAIAVMDARCAGQAERVGAGAHPQLLDPWGSAVCRSRGSARGYREDPRLPIAPGRYGIRCRPRSHLKPHGSLSTACVDADLAMAWRENGRTGDWDLILSPSRNRNGKAGEKLACGVPRGLRRSRLYDEGLLVSRKVEGAMIHDPDVAPARRAHGRGPGGGSNMAARAGARRHRLRHGDNPAASPPRSDPRHLRPRETRSPR